MTKEELKRANEIRQRLDYLSQEKYKIQYCIDYLSATRNPISGPYIRICVPANNNKSMDIKDSSVVNEVLSNYISKIDSWIKELEEEFNAL